MVFDFVRFVRVCPFRRPVVGQSGITSVAVIASLQVSELPTMRRPILAIFAAVASVSFAQDYGDNYADYADNQDNLYANYAAKQEAKAV